jgi:hypothetical protein
MTRLLRRHLKTVIQFGKSIQAENIFCVGGGTVETSNSFCTRGTFSTFIATRQIAILQARHTEGTVGTFLVGGTVATNTRCAANAWFTGLTLIATFLFGMINALAAQRVFVATVPPTRNVPTVPSVCLA